MALEIRLEQLDSGPGLLPFKLGQTKLITQFHSFIQYIDLTDLENQLDSVSNQLDYFRTKLDNNTLPIFELQIDYLTSKLTKIASQLKSLEPNRIKRGLVDGLGSFIKSITGNLDHSDAEKYNSAIRILENNENKLVTEINNHISLNKEWMSRYADVVTSITENQVKINDTIASILDKFNLSEVKFAKFAQLLAITTENIDDIYVELVRLEDNLAFIRASSMHHSMLSIDNLRSMISRLKQIYSNKEVLDIDLRDYYNIIRPGSYFVDKRIVVIFKIPIVSPSDFELYHLSIVPNRLHQTFLPPHPFLATDGKTFMYMEAECPKSGHYLLCEATISRQPREHPDCIQGIIINQSLEKSCRPTTISLTREAMEQLDDRHYTLVFPRPTKVELQCERQEFVSLNGSYLATIPSECSIRTSDITITNVNDEIKGQPLKIAEFPNYYDQTGAKEIPHITLNSINLKSLQHLQERVMIEKPVKINQTDTSIYHTTIPLYAIVLAAAVLASLIFIRRYTPKVKDGVTMTSNPGNDHSYAVCGAPGTQEPVPATFSLKVLK